MSEPATSPAAPARTRVSGSAPKPWLVDLLLLGALWGASFLFMRIGAPEFGAIPTAAFRVAVATLMLLPWVAWRGQLPQLRQHWKPALAIGVLNSGLPFVLFAFALITLNAGLGAVLNATVPMFGALIAWAWFGDRPNKSRALGLVIGFAGVALLAGKSAGVQSGADARQALWAVLACLGACLSYGVAASATRRYLQGAPALATATGSQLGATLFLLLPALWFLPTQMPSLRAWLALLALGVLCTGFAYILFFRLIANAGPQRALTVTFLVPVFAVAYGAIFLRESVSAWMLMCAVVIVCGVMLSTGLVQLGRRPRAR